MVHGSEREHGTHTAANERAKRPGHAALLPPTLEEEAVIYAAFAILEDNPAGFIDYYGIAPSTAAPTKALVLYTVSNPGDGSIFAGAKAAIKGLGLQVTKRELLQVRGSPRLRGRYQPTPLQPCQAPATQNHGMLCLSPSPFQAMEQCCSNSSEDRISRADFTAVVAPPHHTAGVKSPHQLGQRPSRRARAAVVVGPACFKATPAFMSLKDRETSLLLIISPP
jgi:hypothetical protein